MLAVVGCLVLLILVASLIPKSKEQTAREAAMKKCADDHLYSHPERDPVGESNEAQIERGRIFKQRKRAYELCMTLIPR